MKQLTGGDGFWYFMETESKHRKVQHFSILFVYDQSEVEGGVQLDAIVERLGHVASEFDMLKKRVVEVPLNVDYPYLVDDPDFDLASHVHRLGLPRPGGWKELSELLSNLHSKPVDMTRPLWELYVIDGLDSVDFVPEGSLAMMLKFHHSIIDGATAMQIIPRLHDLQRSKKRAKPASSWDPEATPNPAGLFVKAGLNNLRRTLTTGQMMLKMAVGNAMQKLTGQQTLEEKPAPTTHLNQKDISTQRVWDIARFSLSDFRAAKNAVKGATVNDVVLTVCGGAMARYYASKGDNLAQNLSAWVPVSTREAGSDSAGGNQVFLSRSSLFTLEPDPLKRMKLVSEEMRQIKESDTGRQFVALQDELPAPVLRAFGNIFMRPGGPGKKLGTQHSTIITNLPGPQQTLYFCGAKLAMLTGLALLSSHMHISHAVSSYKDDLIIGPLSTPRTDMPFYIQCLERSFEDLQQAIAAQTTQTKKQNKKQDEPVEA